jgi:hypothetical protein
VHSDLAEEPESPRLVAPLLMGLGELKGTVRVLCCLFQSAGQQRRLAQIRHSQREAKHPSYTGGLFHGLL